MRIWHVLFKTTVVSTFNLSNLSHTLNFTSPTLRLDDSESERYSEWCPALCHINGQKWKKAVAWKRRWPGKRGKVYKETGGLCKIRNNALSHSDTAVSSSSYSARDGINQICVISCKDRKWLRLHSVGHFTKWAWKQPLTIKLMNTFMSNGFKFS